ncbi:phosphoribosyltransferase [Hydrogenimonas sp.]
MRFRDRKEAGEHLARALMRYKKEHPLVLVIPRGGTEVGYEVAKALDADFDLLIARKLPFPDNPESGFGAIAEDGSLYLIPYYTDRMDPSVVEAVIESQKNKMLRRIRTLRGGRPLILVDDGIAIGVDDACCHRVLQAQGCFQDRRGRSRGQPPRRPGARDDRRRRRDPLHAAMVQGRGRSLRTLVRRG